MFYFFFIEQIVITFCLRTTAKQSCLPKALESLFAHPPEFIGIGYVYIGLP
jgi:hypothetical protein